MRAATPATSPSDPARPSPGEPRDGLEAALASVDAWGPRLSGEERDALEHVLWEDVTSEYDARFYGAWLAELPVRLGPRFRALEREWALDEERHHVGALRIYRRLFGWPRERARALRERRPDFGPIAHLFEDEFAIACLGAYDELATVRAYRANLPHYDRLGPALGGYVRSVIADEAWHYHRFLDLLRSDHAARLDEGAEAVRRIRASEGIAYGNTFVLDHDDPVFTRAILDDAARVLARQLERAARGARGSAAGQGCEPISSRSRRSNSRHGSPETSAT